MGNHINAMLIFLTMAMLVISLDDTATASRVMDTNLGDSDASFKGENNFDNAGISVAIAGDVNGDGYDDILIGAIFNSEAGFLAGQAYLIFGKESGWSMDRGLANVDASFLGESGSDKAGVSVAGAGDVNGDGYDDILIGALGDDDGGEDAGQAYLILGKATGWSRDTDLANADASFWGESAGDWAGGLVAGARDVNGDGYDDILIGAYHDNDGGENAGQTYLIFGKTSGWSMDSDLSNADASFWGEDEFDLSGYSVAGVGDVNADGYDDILIGAYYNDDAGSEAGQTYIILGKASGWSMDTDLSEADASFRGESAIDRSGRSVSGAGDVNHDGFDDLLVGALFNDEGGKNTGQTYLIFGKASGWSMDTSLADSNASFWGEVAEDLAGFSISGGGDVNNDGYDDILIGAKQNGEAGTNTGQTYLILGKASGWSMDTNLSQSDASYLGESREDQSGNSVSITGDVNGDGKDDILIGAHKNDENADTAGQAYLVFFNPPPEWVVMPVLNAVEDIPLAYNFSRNVSDPDTPVLDLIITSRSPYVTALRGLNVTFLFPNGVETAEVFLTLSDGLHEAVASVNFTVLPVNDPPNHDIPEGQTATATVPWTMDLTSHIWDIDNETDDLDLMVDSPYATVDGLNLSVLFPDGIEEYDLWFNISDGLNQTPVNLHFTITRAPGPPGAPTYFTVTARDVFVDLEWRAPQYDGGSSILGYRIYRGLTPDSLSPLVDLDAYTVTYEDADITTGVTYHYAVQAYNQLGTSIFSNIGSAMVVGLPGVPKNFDVTASIGSVTLTWEPPETDGGEPIGGYRIFRGPVKDAVEIVDWVTETSYEDTNIVNGETYWYQVLAFTNVGDGPRTVAKKATPMGPPDAPAFLTISPRLNGLFLTWDGNMSDGGSPIIGYKIYRGDSLSSLEPHDQVTQYYTEYTDTGLTPGKEYHYAITALNEVLEGEMGPAISGIPYGLPSAPLDLVAEAGDGVVELSWGPPQEDGGLPVHGYIIVRGVAPDTMSLLVPVDGETTYTDATVSNGVTYYYAVAAVNEEGPGESARFDGVTPMKPLYRPGQVILGEPVATKKAVTLKWSAPEDDGGSPVTDYVIYRGESEDELEVFAEVGPIDLTWTDEDVKQGRTYWYTVAPKNDVGEGDPSTVFKAKVPKEDESPGFSVMSTMLVILAVLIRLDRGRRRT